MKQKPLFSELDRRKNVTIVELAQLSGIPASSLREWAIRKEIPGAFRKGKNHRWRFHRDELEKWWADLQQV